MAQEFADSPDEWGERVPVQTDHLIDPERIVCVAVRGRNHMEVFLDGYRNGEPNHLTITDPPSIDRILELEKAE